MSRNKFLIMGILLAIAAGVSVAFLLAAALPTAEVVKVKGSVHPGDSLSGRLYVEEIPKRAFPEGAFKSIKDLENGYSLATLHNGDILRTHHVAETLEDGGTISARLRIMNMEGKVAFALEKSSTQGLRVSVGDQLRINAVSRYYDPEKANSQTTTDAPILMFDTNDQMQIQKPTIIIPATTVIYVPNAETESDNGVVVALTDEEFLTLSQAKEIGKLYAAVLPVGTKKDIAEVKTNKAEEKTEN